MGVTLLRCLIYGQPLQFFYAAAKNNTLTLAGRIFFKSPTHSTMFNRICQEEPTAQEWATITSGHVPTALVFISSVL